MKKFGNTFAYTECKTRNFLNYSPVRSPGTRYFFRSKSAILAPVTFSTMTWRERERREAGKLEEKEEEGVTREGEIWARRGSGKILKERQRGSNVIRNNHMLIEYSIEWSLYRPNRDNE